MPTVRSRLHKKNKDGSYSTIYLETDASIVLLGNGTALEDTIAQMQETSRALGGAHALKHTETGSDPITPDSIGAASAFDISAINAGIENAHTRLQNILDSAIETITDIPYQVGTVTYSGGSQAPVWGNYDTSRMGVSGDISGVNAGEYSAVFTAKKGFQFDGGAESITVTWRIDHAVISTVPSQNGSLTYTGSAQSPSWSNYNSAQLTLSGVTSGTNAGTYTAKFTPTENYQWADGTAEEKSVNWSIGKAAGSLSLSTTSVSFTSASGSQQVTVTRSGTGAIHAVSSNTSVATCSVSGNVVTIRSGSTNGSCSISITVDEDDNFTSPSEKPINVSRDVFTVPTTLGIKCTWAGHDWIVCHVESDRIYLACAEIYEFCAFDSDQNHTSYAGSNLAARAKAFENSLPASAKANAINTTVNGVTAKIFVASKEQLDGGFSWFNSNDRRDLFDGSANFYWTSSTHTNTTRVWYVYRSSGKFDYTNPTQTGGLRPFVALKRT